MSVLESVTPNWRLMRSPLNYVIVFLMVAIGLFLIEAIAATVSVSYTAIRKVS